MTVRFYGDVAHERLRFAVIIARSNGKWVFVRHGERATPECPGGHRETGEWIDDTARRELYEETGAAEYVLRRVGAYGVTRGMETTYGMLYTAEILRLDALPPLEIAEVRLCDTLPARHEWTYPAIQPLLVQHALDAGCLPDVHNL